MNAQVSVFICQLAIFTSQNLSYRQGNLPVLVSGSDLNTWYVLLYICICNTYHTKQV